MPQSIVQEGPVVKEIGPFRFHALIHRELGMALPSFALRLVGEDGKPISLGTIERASSDLAGLRNHVSFWMKIQEQRIVAADQAARGQAAEPQQRGTTLDLLGGWRQALSTARWGLHEIRGLIEEEAV